MKLLKYHNPEVFLKAFVAKLWQDKTDDVMHIYLQAQRGKVVLEGIVARYNKRQMKERFNVNTRNGAYADPTVGYLEIN